MKRFSIYFGGFLKVGGFAFLTFLLACNSLPPLPGQIRYSDQKSNSNPQSTATPRIDSVQLKEYWRKGSQHFMNEEWEPAIEEFSAALKVSPKNAKILTARGWAYAKVRQERLALNDFRQALSQEDLVEAHVGIAELAKAALPRLNRRSEAYGAYNQGQQHYQRAITMRPDDEYLYFGLATLQYIQHHHNYVSNPLALEYPLYEVQRAIQLSPNFIAALILAAQIQSELGNEAEAARAADRIIALRPEFAEAYYIRGLVMSRTKNRTQSVAFARKALELDPSNQKYRRAIDNWRRPIPPTQGEILGAMSAVLLGAFLISDPNQYTGSTQSQYDPWKPNVYQRHAEILMEID